MGVTRRAAGGRAGTIGSVIFSIYTANFGSSNETYGALGAVVVVMLWLLLTTFVVLWAQR